MEQNVPNYNLHNVVRLFNDMNFPYRKSGYEGRKLEVTDLTDDQSVINSVFQQVLNTLSDRERRAIQLLYGLPDSEPMSANGAAQIFYRGFLLSSDLVPQLTTKMTSRRRIKSVALTPNDAYIQSIINAQGINPEQVTDVEVRIRYNQVGQTEVNTDPHDRREYPKRENITPQQVYSIRQHAFSKLRHPFYRGRTLESLIK